MKHRLTMPALTLFTLFAAACESNETHVVAAGAFTQRYSESRLSNWEVRAKAAGRDCTVLLVNAAVVMDDAIVESLHYGAGAYDVWNGGVQQFSRERGFRAVAYRDQVGRVWTYGSVTPAEAGTLETCR